MSFEDRLRNHLRSAAQGLPQPPETLQEVTRRGHRRRAAGIATAGVSALLLLVAVPAVWAVLSQTGVDFDAIAPPATTPTPAPAPTPTDDATPVTPEAPVETAPSPGTLALGDLGAPVLAWGPYEHGRLEIIDREGDHVLWSGSVEAAFPDGRRGVVLQPAGLAEVHWVPDADEIASVRLAEADGGLVLRGLLADGRVLYSLPPQGEERSEDDAERFYAIALEVGARPELIATAPAFETWTVGPALTVAGPVHAGCHMHCGLSHGLVSEGGETVYNGLAIEGLTATPDGRLVAFVEFDPAFPEEYGDRPTELVVLDGASFAERARVTLPWQPGDTVGLPTVSLSADGQRILVSLGAAGESPPVAPPTGPPTTAFLVEHALSAAPEIHRLDFSGAVRWVDPVAASGAGGPVTAEERDTADRLIAFASRSSAATFGAVPFADEVALGLGPDITAQPRPAAELADAAAWELDAEDFRARVGPFSALELLAGTGEVAVTGGPHRHCASPPVPVPAEVARLRQVSIQPTSIDSCLDWFTVDLFLTDDGEIAAVTLDLYEP